MTCFESGSRFCGDHLARVDLTDAQLGVLEPLLPKGVEPGRPSVHSKRQLINGIRFPTRTGIPRRDLWSSGPPL
ncbi:transposase [Streptomyces atratus]|uniref:transposase n=1 Tax=Streptomyces atratus TaxID=1893 RepID=UPI001E3723D5|nr:transposase [Streptomyces atratus]